MAHPVRQRLLAALLTFGLLSSLGLLTFASSAQAAKLDLETLTAAEAEKMLEKGQITSVELVKDYYARIAALSKSGPGLNAVTQLNPLALEEAKKTDEDRRQGIILGPLMGVPIGLKDIIDATPMYTTAGDWALRESFPEKDSGVARNLRAHGIVILGKLGLSEWANSFGSQPSGFSNVTGQVLNANDAAEGPSGSSSGSGAAEAAGLVPLTIGTETGGSIISPSTAEEIVGLKPTLGLVPGFGIAPIDVSRDTAGPMEKTVQDVALTLQSLAEIPGTDPESDEEYEGMEGPNFLKNGDILPAPFAAIPNYSAALTTSFVNGKRIGYNNNTCTVVPPASTCTPTPTQEATQKAVTALEAAGAIMVPDAQTTAEKTPPLPSGYEAHATIDEYYKHLGAKVPVHSLLEEVAVDNTNPQEGEKDGNSTHAKESEAEDAPGGKNQKEFEEILPIEKKATQAAIEKMMNEPSGGGGPVIAVVGSVPSAPQAGMPLMVVPGGYTATQRRPIGIGIAGGAFDEFNMIGVGYVIEQSLKLQQSPANVDPALYRCAHTVPAEPFAGRKHCNPDYVSVSEEIGKQPRVLPFPLETTSAATLEQMMNAKTLTSKQLVKSELYRIALTNADGPSIQAIRNVNPDAVEEAESSDRLRSKKKAPLGPLAGIPVVVDDSMNVFGLPTSGGSIALQDTSPSADSTIVAKLKAAGAIILGDANTTELGGAFEGPNMPQGYSSLGGQVLLASDTNKNVGGASGGSADAVSIGFAPLAVGMESSTEAAQLIAPASNAGVVGLKPTVGLVSRTGVLPVARSQDSPGPIGQTVTDVATTLGVLAGPDPSDPATLGQPRVPNYLAGLSPTRAERQENRGDRRRHHRPLSGSGGYASGARGNNRRSDARHRYDRAKRDPVRIPQRSQRLPVDSERVRETQQGRQITAGNHRIQQCQPSRGPEIRPGRAARRGGGGNHQPDDQGRLRRRPRERKAGRPRSDRRHPQIGWRRGDHGPQRKPAGGDRRPSRLPRAERSGRVRRPEQQPGRRPDRCRFHRHGVQRGRTPGLRLRLRTEDESPSDRSRLHGLHDVPEPGSVRSTERDQPEHVPMRAGERVRQAVRLQPGRTGESAARS